MNWLLFVWQLAGLALVLLSINRLHKELHVDPPVKRCEDCEWCREAPEFVRYILRDDERICGAGRGSDCPICEDGEFVSLVRVDGYCDCFRPAPKGGGRNA